MGNLLYFIRLVLVLIFVAIVGLFGSFICLLRPFNPHNLKLISFFLWRGIQILGIKLDVRHEERLDQRPCVIVSNHQENMDVFIGARMIPDKTVSIGKKSILYIPFFGLFYWLSGNILIDRNNRKSALGTMDQTANIIKEKGISVWILAEGTRSKGRGVLPFKKGAFVTAVKAQVPVIPIAISSYKGAINLKKWHAGTIIIEVLPLISIDNYSMSNIPELKDAAFRAVSEKVKALDLELQGPA